MYRIYHFVVLERPIIVILISLLVLASSAYYATQFRFDVSAESLTLENDLDLNYYREIRERYGSDDFLVVAYTPKEQLFSHRGLAKLASLKDDLAALEHVESVVSILDVPLFENANISLNNFSYDTRTLSDTDTDIDPDAAKHELINSELYRDRLISADGKTTALQVNFQRDERFWSLLNARDHMRRLNEQASLDLRQLKELETLNREFEEYNVEFLKRQRQDIRQVRETLDAHREDAEMHLGGVPMIATDMMGFIRHDVATFGISVVAILAAVLALLFRHLYWVVLPFTIAIPSCIFSVGVLGYFGWPVTVVSSNFLSLVLIFSISLGIHLIVRYQELFDSQPDATQIELVSQTMKTKFSPCLYTVITTMVAFGSLVLSDIRPVIDFGWMMAIALASAFIFAFTLFPSFLVKLPKIATSSQNSITATITGYCAANADKYRVPVVTLSFLVVLAVGAGMWTLSVENRFIDYFHKDTEIYQGMVAIDQRLGGTTPLDVIIDAPKKTTQDRSTIGQVSDDLDALFEDDSDDAITTRSYWFNSHRIGDIKTIHEYLDGRTDTGKVLSLSTAITTLESLEKMPAIDDFILSLIYKKVPAAVKQELIDPYFNEDTDQIRFALRINDTDKNLKRDQLIKDIQHYLATSPNLEGTTARLTGMLVLYNNMLQSLFRSQILTLGVVFFVIAVAFAVLFRSLSVAIIAILPNLMAAALVLGTMGWLGIPLDIMTITIAAISVGIAVDDTIHYVHRYREEWSQTKDYAESIYRAHASIGRAMYFTTFAISIGFVVLVLSDFVPTVHFGLLTGFAMLSALVCDLLVLPALLAMWKPYKNIEK